MTQRCALNGNFQLNAVKCIGIDYDEIVSIHNHKGQKRNIGFHSFIHYILYKIHNNYAYDTNIYTDHIVNAQFDKKRTYRSA